MYKQTIIRALLAITLLFVAGLGVIKLKASSTASQQQGYRGTGMAQLDDATALQARDAAQGEPTIHKPARVRPNGPIAGSSYKNVQVLGELSIGEFGRTMTAMTDWVAGKDSCNHCHVDGDFASDDKYTKIVARRMLKMVRRINNNWQPHVGETGVTCYTCHRGQALPSQRWFTPLPDLPKGAFAGHRSQNTPSPTVRLAALPNEPFSAFLTRGPESVDDIRVAASAVLVHGPRRTAENAEKTYGLMLHLTQALGVNCTYCHNSRAFASWAESSPQRVTAWQGIRMVRELNSRFLEPLSGVFPPNSKDRLGPTGDAAKVNCATCHQGVNKPLKGFQMAKHYPGLTGPAGVAAAPTAAVPEAPAATPAAAPPEVPARAASAPDSAASAMDWMAAAHPASSATRVRTVVVATAAPQGPAASTATAVEPVNCIDLGAAGRKSGMAVAQPAAARQVVGRGRLSFYSAPDSGCEMLGVYAQAGDTLQASVDQAGYTAVRYRRMGSGGEMQGWVRADRLALVSAKTEVAATPVPALPVAPASAPPAAAPAAALPPSATIVMLVVAQAEPCRSAQAAASQGRQPPTGGAGRRVVTGTGRLQFYAAPDPACPQDGVFILAGEAVEAVEQFGDFTTVRYVNPRTGKPARGWVASTRLAAAGSTEDRAANPIVSQAGARP